MLTPTVRPLDHQGPSPHAPAGTCARFTRTPEPASPAGPRTPTTRPTRRGPGQASLVLTHQGRLIVTRTPAAL